MKATSRKASAQGLELKRETQKPRKSGTSKPRGGKANPMRKGDPKPPAIPHRAAAVWQRKLDVGVPLDTLNASLESAFEEVGGYATSMRLAAKQMRESGQPEELCQIAESRAARYEAAATPDFQNAARRLVGLVTGAIVSGDSSGLATLVKSLAKRANSHARRDWLETCRNSLELARPKEGLAELSRELCQGEVENLPHMLAMIDGRAASLTSNVVVEILERFVQETIAKRRTAEGFAARLACQCGAFGYGKGDQEKAQTAFRNLQAQTT